MPQTKKAKFEDADLIALEELDEIGGDDEEEGWDDEEDGWDDEEEEEPEAAEIVVEDIPAAGAPKPNRRRRKITDADKLEAYRAGKAAYGAGVAAREWPSDLDPELYRDWQNGWQAGHTLEHQGRGVVIYTPFDPNERDILKLEQNYRRFWHGPQSNTDVRDLYPALPWDMANLRGATFRNLHVGSIYHLADRIMPDRSGKPQLVEEPIYLY
ncbi:MAG: hypothetical protein HC828_01610, partial [Blastochloris sp.]|nr:hypothetical protein [Blastochloris sp.]